MQTNVIIFQTSKIPVYCNFHVRLRLIEEMMMMMMIIIIIIIIIYYYFKNLSWIYFFFKTLQNNYF